MRWSSRTGSYVKGLASGYSVTLATILVGLWMTPFSLRHLDRERFAIFSLASDVLMWLGLMELGLTAVLASRAAQLSGKPDQSELNRLASTAFFAQATIAGLMALAGMLIAAGFPSFFSLRPGLERESQVVMALMVVGVVLSTATQTFSALLIAHQQIHVDNMIRLILIGVRTVVAVVLLERGVGLPSLAVANLTAVAVTAVLAVSRVRQLLPHLSIGREHFDRTLVSEYLKTGTWFSVGGLAGLLIMNLDRIVTAKVVSVATVTTLTLTARLYTLVWSVVRQVTDTARPALAQIVGEGRTETVGEKYSRLMKMSTGLAIWMAASVWAGNEEFIRWWVGEENFGGATLNTVLAVNLVLHCWILPNRAVLTAALAFVRENSISRSVEGVLNLAASLLLGSWFGVVGVAAGTGVAGLVSTWWYLPRLTARYLKSDLRSLMKPSVPPLAVHAAMMVPSAAVGFVVSRGHSGVVGAILGMAVTGALGAPSVWCNCVPDEVKRTVRRWVFRGPA